MQPLLILDELKSHPRVMAASKHYMQSQHVLLPSHYSSDKHLGKLIFTPRALGHNSYQILHSL